MYILGGGYVLIKLIFNWEKHFLNTKVQLDYFCPSLQWIVNYAWRLKIGDYAANSWRILTKHTPFKRLLMSCSCLHGWFKSTFSVSKLTSMSALPYYRGHKSSLKSGFQPVWDLTQVLRSNNWYSSSPEFELIILVCVLLKSSKNWPRNRRFSGVMPNWRFTVGCRTCTESLATRDYSRYQ